MRTRVGLVPNPDHEIRKAKKKHNKCKQESNKILLQRKNMKTLWQKKYSKLVLNKLKVMKNIPLFIPIGHLV